MNDEAPGSLPAHDLDAEAVVLSAALLVPEAMPMLRLVVEPADLYSTANRDILAACYELADDGRGVDLVAVAGHLRDTGKLARVGGPGYIAMVTDSTPALSNVEEHARRVVLMSRLREAEQFGGWVKAESRVATGDVENFLQRVAEKALEVTALDRLSRRATSALIGDDMPDVLRDAKRARGKGLVGLATGWSDLDKLCGGLPPGLHFLLGRAGMGKTSFITGLAHNVASARGEQKQGVAIFSLEMPRAQTITRLLAAESSVALNDIERAEICASEWPAVENAGRALSSLPIWIDDSSRTTVPEFRAKLRLAESALRTKGAVLSLAIIDYIQLMGGREQSREERVAENSKRLVEAAKQFNIPILATSQMNRESEGRLVKSQDRRPKLADARESGQIEQDGGRIFGVYRDEYYDRESEDRGLAEIHVLKCRQGGSTGVVKVKANERTLTFRDLTRATPPDGYEEFDATENEF